MGEGGEGGTLSHRIKYRHVKNLACAVYVLINLYYHSSLVTLHLCILSLGVVFLGVTDTVDLGVDEVLPSLPPLPLQQHRPLHQSSREADSDGEMARSLELNERDIQLERDTQLAEQMQMKENSYMTPRLVFKDNKTMSSV